MSTRVRMWSNRTAISALPSRNSTSPMITRLMPAGGHVQQRQEDPEEQERGTEVTLDDHDAESDRPHRDHRCEIRQGRQAQRPDPGVLLHEQRPVLRQIARQEDDEDDLEQLRRLAGERADLERQPLAVDLGAEHEGEEQQPDPGRRPGVLVAPQPAVGADDDPERRGHGQRAQQPDELDLGEAQASSRRTSGSRDPGASAASGAATRHRASPRSAGGSGRSAARRGPGRDVRRAGRPRRSRGRARRTARTGRRRWPPARRSRRQGPARPGRAGGAPATGAAGGSAQ